MLRHSTRTGTDLIVIARRHKWLIAGAMLVGVGAASVVNLTAKAVYQGEATVMVLSSRSIPGTLITVPGSASGRPAAIYNQIQVLTSRTLAARVFDRIARDPAGRDLLSVEGRSRTRDEAVSELRANLQAVPAANADVVVIRTRAGSPDAAVTVTNAYVDEYLDYNKTSARDEISEVKSFLTGQLAVVQERLHAAEESLKVYQERHRMVGLPAEAEAVVEQVTQFEGLLNRARTEYGMSKARLEYLRGELRSQMETLPEDIAEVSSPTIVSLRETVAELEGARSQLLANGYDESHPKMVQVSEEIDETKRRLIETTRAALDRRLSTQDPLAYSQDLVEKILVLEIDVESMAARIEKLEEVVDDYSERLAGLPATSLELARLERERRANEDIYKMLLESSEEARIEEAREVGEVRVIDRAERPESPVAPRRRLNLAIGGFLGLALGLGLALSRDARDDTLRSIAHIESCGDLDVLGVIPAFNSGRDRGTRSRNGNGRAEGAKRKLLIGHQSHSQIAEAYRTLRTNLCYLGEAGPPRSLVITSPGPGEGKSTTSANVAVAMARQGTRVLLVDCDLRRPVLHEVFELPGEPGLCDVLQGNNTLGDVLAPTRIENLAVIPGGNGTDGPAELLGSYKMEDVLRTLTDQFECVVLDCPPLLLVTDAAVVAAKARGTLLVVRAEGTCLGALIRSKAQLDNVNACVLGVVVNGVTRAAGAYGEYGFSNYYHDYYRYYSRALSRGVTGADRDAPRSGGR
jgi:capsular exopolysaccharide synthesis family protein